MSNIKINWGMSINHIFAGIRLIWSRGWGEGIRIFHLKGVRSKLLACWYRNLMVIKRVLSMRSSKCKCNWNMVYILSQSMANISSISKILWKLFLKILQLCSNSVNKTEFNTDISLFNINKNSKTVAFPLVAFPSVNNSIK